MIESVKTRTERQFCQPLVSGLGWCGYFADAYATERERSHKPLSLPKLNQIISANKKISYQICSNELPSPTPNVENKVYISYSHLYNNMKWCMDDEQKHKWQIMSCFWFFICFANSLVTYHHRYSIHFEQVWSSKSITIFVFAQSKIVKWKVCNLWENHCHVFPHTFENFLDAPFLQNWGRAEFQNVLIKLFNLTKFLPGVLTTCNPRKHVHTRCKFGITLGFLLSEARKSHKFKMRFRLVKCENRVLMSFANSSTQILMFCHVISNKFVIPPPPPAFCLRTQSQSSFKITREDNINICFYQQLL